MMLNRLPALRALALGRASQYQPEHFSLIDMGSDTIKVAVVRAENGQVNVLGHSLVPAHGRDVAGGRAQAAALAGTINTALQEAEDASEALLGYKVVPDHALFSLPGRTLAGKLFTVKQRRTAAAPVTRKELDVLWERALRLTKQGLPTLPRVKPDWLPQTVTSAGLWLDNHLVNDPVGLKGQLLALSVYGFTCHPAIVRGIEQLAEKLEVEIYRLVPAPQSLAMVIPAREALVLDVGASGTDCYLLQHNTLVAANRVSLGGAFLTRSMSQAFKCDLESAEALKIAFASQALSRADEVLVQKSLHQPLRHWGKAVTDAICKMLPADSPPRLPGRLYFAGGSAVLPGLKNQLLYAVRKTPVTFERAPEIANLGQKPLPGFQHQPSGFKGTLFSLALSLGQTI